MTQGNKGTGYMGRPINGSSKVFQPKDTSISTKQAEATAANVACRSGISGPAPTAATGKKSL